MDHRILQDMMDHANFEGIPIYMREGLVNWCTRGVPPGGFLTAVLSNDLREACARADSTNQHCLFAYVQFLYMHAPAGCWGSPEKVRAWAESFNTPTEPEAA